MALINLDDTYVDNIQEHSVCERNVECNNCGALFYEKQNKKCCKNGKIKLPLIKPPPKPLRNLIDRKDENSEVFFRHIRMFNSLHSFASLGEYGLDKSLSNLKKGILTFINNFSLLTKF